MHKKILIILAVVALIGALAYYFILNKPHRDIKGSQEDFTITAEQLFKTYSEDEAGSNTKYLDKVIGVSGTVGEIQSENPDEPTLALSTGVEGMTVSCGFNKDQASEIASVKVGDKVKVKGKCDGIGMFGVILTRCSLVLEDK